MSPQRFYRIMIQCMRVVLALLFLIADQSIKPRHGGLAKDEYDRRSELEMYRAIYQVILKEELQS